MFMYREDGGKKDPLEYQESKLEVIKGRMGEMKECAGFDVVLLMREGELIGRYVLYRINAAYQQG